jgi:hypothetical protein
VETIDATGWRRSRRAVEWIVGLAIVAGIFIGIIGSATMNVSRPLTIGATSTAAVLLGVAGVTAMWRLPRISGKPTTHRRRRATQSLGGFALVVALWFASVSIVSGVSGWTPRGWLREVLTGPEQLAALPLNTSPPMNAVLYFGAISTIIGTVRDVPHFAVDFALVRSHPDLCAAVVVVAADLAAGSGSIVASFTGPRWTALEPAPDSTIGGLPFIRQRVLTPPATERPGAPITANVTVRENLAIATGRYTVQLLGASGPHRLWSVASTSGTQMVECTQYQR